MVPPFSEAVYLYHGEGDSISMISSKLQKIIVFIPLINASLILVSVYNTMKANWIGKNLYWVWA